MKKIIQQAFFQLRNQPLLSVITVLGTALAIALIMVILIVYQAKTADYAPEVNRSRSLYVKWERTVYDKKDPNSAGHSRPSLWLVKEIFYPLTTPEAVTATYEGGEVLVGTVGSDEEMNTPLMLTDAAFWKVYQFRFLARELLICTASAINSLPVPLSPVISTEALVRAILLMVASTSISGLLFPMIWLRSKPSLSTTGASGFCLSAVSSRAVSIRCIKATLFHGFVIKSKAPACIP